MANGISKIERIANSILDDAVRSYCLVIINKINEFKSTSDEKNPLWTYRTFSTWVNSEIEDESLIQSINFLSSSIAPLLDRHYLWISEESDQMHPIEDEFVRDALINNVAEDPDTGELIQNPRDHIVPYFTPSLALEAKRG